jgi:hypothetical protein
MAGDIPQIGFDNPASDARLVLRAACFVATGIIKYMSRWD